MIPIETFGYKGEIWDVSKIPADTIVSIDLRQRGFMFNDNLFREFNGMLRTRAEELDAKLHVWNQNNYMLLEFQTKEKEVVR